MDKDKDERVNKTVGLTVNRDEANVKCKKVKIKVDRRVRKLLTNVRG